MDFITQLSLGGNVYHFLNGSTQLRAIYDWDWAGWKDTNEAQTGQFWGMVKLMGDAINGLPADPGTEIVRFADEPKFVPLASHHGATYDEEYQGRCEGCGMPIPVCDGPGSWLCD